VYEALSHLLGIGYFIVPLLSVLLSIVLFRSFKDTPGIPKIIGASLFFISGLGLIDAVMDGQGGIVGSLISTSLIRLVDIYATIVLLLAILIVSLFIILDTKPQLRLFTFLSPLKSVRELFGRHQGRPEDDYQTYRAYAGEDEKVSEDKTEKSTAVAEIIDFRENIGEAGQKGPIITVSRSSIGMYKSPPLSLLEKDKGRPDVGDTRANANIIKRTLENFGIHVEVDEVAVGPTVTRYALKPAEGVRISKIVALQNNLELALAAHPVRIEAPIPGKSQVGIEVPNASKATLGLASLLGRDEFTKSQKPLLITLGRDIAGMPHYADLSKMPHILIAGATGSGKSVTIHGMIASLIFRNAPETMRFIMIDPKRVELTLYNNIPHLLTPVLTDAKKIIFALKWAAREMDRRYDILEAEAVRDIASYHENVLAPALKRQREEEEMIESMPYIVIIIDELADIMHTYPREFEAAIVRLAQMSRAVGIHLILSTQRPSVNVITGLIKANIPARIALQVSSQIDSRTILDSGGAEKLLGAGDMLYLSGEMSKPKRLQSPLISEIEVKGIVSYIIRNNDYKRTTALDFKEENGRHIALSESLEDEEIDDALYEDAREAVVRAGKASTSYLQRKLRIGYARAARLMDMLEERGIIGPQDGAKPREVLLRGARDRYVENEDNNE
jgi:S-DNA-T family DNA segregation ATPase FtsK/SpoIIIE